jgi:hemerythrin
MPGSGPLQWSDAMLAGVAEIDRQHRVLVDALNEARAKLSDDSFDPLFERITRDLLGYAIRQFDAEERLMRERGYAAVAPEAALHVAQHRGFLEKVAALRDAARRGEPGSKAALLAFLEDWLANHIMTVDKRLGQFIRREGKKPGPAKGGA